MFKENTNHLQYDVFGVETYLPQKQLKELKIKMDIQRSDSFLAASNIRKYNRIMLLNGLMLLYTSLSFGACDKKVQEKSDVPEWFISAPRLPNAIVAVGSGDSRSGYSRAMALCNALADLAVRVKVTVEDYTSGDTSLSRLIFE